MADGVQIRTQIDAVFGTSAINTSDTATGPLTDQVTITQAIVEVAVSPTVTTLLNEGGFWGYCQVRNLSATRTVYLSIGTSPSFDALRFAELPPDGVALFRSSGSIKAQAIGGNALVEFFQTSNL